MMPQLVLLVCIPSLSLDSLFVGRQGKKLFVGTTSGRVFMFESGAFGLLSQPSCEHPLRRDHGAVIALVYCERDEVVVAVIIMAQW